MKHFLAYRGGWGGARLRREKGRGRRESEDRGGRRGGGGGIIMQREFID